MIAFFAVLCQIQAGAFNFFAGTQTDHGFDEWYGPLRTYDECMYLDDPHYNPERDGYSAAVRAGRPAASSAATRARARRAG